MGMDVDYIAAKNAIEIIEKTVSDLPHGEREDIADEIIEFAENLKRKYTSPRNFDVDAIERGTPIVATYGHNTVLDKPFEFLYEFGYYTEHGCVVYKHGECNMQDASAFKLDQIRVATPEDMKNHYWGN